MKWNPEKQCITNDDGTLLEPIKWYCAGNTISWSVTAWPDSTYSKWCLEGLKGSNKPIVDNSDLWAFDSRGANKPQMPDCQKYSCSKRATHDYLRNDTDSHFYLCDKHMHLLKADRFTEVVHELTITYLHGQKP